MYIHIVSICQAAKRGRALPSRKMGVTVARTAGDPLAQASAIRTVARELERNQPISGIRTMEQNISRSMAEPRFRTVLLAPVSRSARRRGMEGLTHDMPVHSEELSRRALAIIGFDQTRWPRLFVLWPLQRVPSASYTPDTSAA